MAEIIFDTHSDTISNAKTQNLSALIGANRFFFYISDAQKNIINQKHYLLSQQNSLADLTTILETEPLLRQSFNQTNIAIDTLQFSFVPNPIYQPNLQKEYLKGISPLSKFDMVFTDEVDELGLKNVHSIDSRLFDLIERYFPVFRMYHTATTFLRRTKRLINGDDVFVNVQPNQLNILVYKNNQFLLYNTYRYNSAEAFLYYILLMYQQFDLDTTHTPLTLMGGIMPNSTIYKLLSTYIRQIKFAKRTKYYQFSPKYSNVPQQFHFDLYTMSVCE